MVLPPYRNTRLLAICAEPKAGSIRSGFRVGSASVETSGVGVEIVITGRRGTCWGRGGRGALPLARSYL